MAVTLRDIARKLNLSHATVSFVLNERRDVAIPESTRQRVLQAAKEMGYRPNRAARTLVMGKTQTLGIWMPSPANPYFGQAFDHLYRLSREAGFETYFCQAGLASKDARPPDWPVDGILGYDVAGLIRTSRLPDRLPVVSVGAHFDDSIDHVGIDLSTGVTEAMHHLIASGRKRIGYVTIDSREEGPTSRIEAYRKAMGAAGLAEEVIHFEVRDRHQIRRLISEYVHDSGLPDALMCYSDWVALAVVRGLHDRGVRIPEEVLVVGHDGIAELEFSTPSVSSIAQPILDASRMGVQFLINRLKDPRAPIQSALLPTTLIVRESSSYIHTPQ
jgi:DNA-binding LacI/PurR family transcriptional regulator